jgi:hypothetical protein
MPIPVQVRTVREALFQAVQRAGGAGEPSTHLLGRWFHEIFADLLGPSFQDNLLAVLADAEPAREAWQAALVSHVYERQVAPRLSQNQAALQAEALAVLNFWQAARQMCAWLTELLWTAQQAGADLVADTLFSSEQAVDCELREPGWTDAVRLTGVADLVCRLPGMASWCVVEFKLGKTSPPADLGQACLYHLMLLAAKRSEDVNEQSTLALISFEPQRRERLFSTKELRAAQGRLTDLIGRLAGVLPDQAPAPPVERPQPPDGDHAVLGRRLVEAFREYGVVLHPDGEPAAGPTFIRHPFILGRGVKFDGVVKHAENVGLRLQLDKTPCVGKEGGRVVVDVRREPRQTVTFAHIRPQLPARDPHFGCSRVPIGVDLNGKLRLADLNEPHNAHLLVAGTTGSGKSEWLRSVIAGLLATNTPETLRLLLIDPKRNAFAWLSRSPFLLEALVYPDEQPATEVFRRLVETMEERYRIFGTTGADTLNAHNRRAAVALPRIVCVCDEYADLLLRDRKQRKELEEQISRLGAKARAAGIHLILATQQPSREIIKGVLDTNIPARVGLMMTKAIESRMLLGESGAENLLGKGDLFFKDIGDPVRLQAAYLSDEERDGVVRARDLTGATAVC